MVIQNREIARYFEQIADYLAIQNANPFRIRAYRNAAEAIERWPVELTKCLKEQGSIPKIPGIGKDLTDKIIKLIKGSGIALLDDLKKKIPSTLLEFLDIAGLGPRRVQALWNKGIKTKEELKIAAKEHKLSELKGFGSDLESKILKSIELGEKYQNRFLLDDAWSFCEEIKKYLLVGMPQVELLVAGSLRRGKETVGDLDLLAISKNKTNILKRLVEFQKCEKVINYGSKKATIQIQGGMQVDLRLIDSNSSGSALLYFTGSKDHNIALRKIAIQYGFKLSEYGLFKGNVNIASKTEKEIYQSLGMNYIEPELREGRGEVESAIRGDLPQLILQSQIKGDLHVHTVASDGHDSIAQMVVKAKRKGYTYLAITDHSKRTRIAGGLNVDAFKKQYEEIDRLNEIYHPFRILKGVEVDILEDGTLDLPDSFLKDTDLTVCSIHEGFSYSSKKQTQRMIKAMDNRYFNILGHPSGRLIGRREPYDYDFEKILRFALERGIYIELNSQPDRLDINDEQSRMAKSFGVPIVISSDAHSAIELDFIEFGIKQARRGWLEKTDVLNTFSFDQLIRKLNSGR